MAGKPLCGLFQIRPCNGMCTYRNPTPEEECGYSCGDPYCCEFGCHGTWMGATEGCNTGSPILIDLRENDRDFDLTSAANGVWFDLNGLGSKQHTAWTSRGSSVAFLVYDRNGNGTVDDGTELFGTAMLKRDGTRANNGFDALADFDAESGNPDGRIDRLDPIFPHLQLWIDANHNGLSEPSELTSLARTRVVALSTGFRERRHRDEHGNWYRLEGASLVARRDGTTRPKRIYDVYFNIEDR